MAHSAVDGTTPTAAFRPSRDTEKPEPQFPYILVVDDEQPMRDFLKRCLEVSGYAVKQAGSAIIALEVMTASPATVVLCDVKMPIHDGLWLTERLCTRWPDVPVIMITAIADEETIAVTRTLGAFDFLTKPIAKQQLLEVVHRAIATLEEAKTRTVDAASTPLADLHTRFGRIEAAYSLECPVRCPSCGDTISTLKAVRLLRTHVNFTSTLPRRGRLVVCPSCLAVLPAELSNF
jgi:FixJ family two-component response regulator